MGYLVAKYINEPIRSLGDFEALFDQHIRQFHLSLLKDTASHTSPEELAEFKRKAQRPTALILNLPNEILDNIMVNLDLGNLNNASLIYTQLNPLSRRIWWEVWQSETVLWLILDEKFVRDVLTITKNLKSFSQVTCMKLKLPRPSNYHFLEPEQTSGSTHDLNLDTVTFAGWSSGTHFPLALKALLVLPKVERIELEYRLVSLRAIDGLDMRRRALAYHLNQQLERIARELIKYGVICCLEEQTVQGKGRDVRRDVWTIYRVEE